MLNIRHILVLLAFTSTIGAHAVTYFVSHNGNDANSGTSQGQAWRTIDRLMQSIYSLQPGDGIRFERGGTYRGELSLPVSGTSSQKITVGAYGTGPKPIISGSAQVTNWTLHSGNIWRASVSGQVKYVYVNGQQMTLARFPNSGWLRNDQGSGTHIQDSELNQANGYWTGATAVIRSSNWSFDAVPVTSHSNSTINFPNIYFNLSNYHWGYFLCNKLSELDMPGEWFHDAAAGQLYLWAPNNANPNSITIEASVHDRGMNVFWQRQHIVISDLQFQHQRVAGIRVDGAAHVEVNNCTFRELYQGVSSYGNNGRYINNQFEDTYASGAYLIDNNSLFQGNTMLRVAMRPGLGENNWGYFGVRLDGQNNIIRDNRLTDIGYIGISMDKNCLVERNVVRNATALLNDGGGIAFDHADGMIIQDNVVVDIIGDLESSAPNFENYRLISHGIYFGNTSIRNTIVRRNTVAHCMGSGVHVDHTMVSSGNEIRDNVLFNNAIQLSVSDYSNYNGPGATPPYHVGSFNGVYTGNIMYSLTKDQFCMKQYNVYSSNPVDFGTFNNNHYFNPYNELSIWVHNTHNGLQQFLTLEQWRVLRNEDANSSRSPLRLDAFLVTEELGANLVPNGNFNSNITGWSGWPTQAQLSRDMTYLDNGALRVHFSNNASYPTFTLRHDAMFNMASGNHYRLSFSTQSNLSGTVKVDVKGASQVSGPQTIFVRDVPFSPERRDMSMVFQSNLTDQAQVRFTNSYLESTYWLDNVELKRVNVVPVDPFEMHVLLINETASSTSVPLVGCWRDVQGALHSGEITIGGFSSVVLIKEDDLLCSLTTGYDELGELSSSVFPNPSVAGGIVRMTRNVEGPVSLRMLDMNGRTVLERPMSSAGTLELELPATLAPGVYVICCDLANGIRTSERLVVQ
ncbi:MAG: right-handed parallel beta-helix repeat-containing protein [Flavobacteriales bacterium]|nr:right-handed parallel beta-helix repeat-containing protein [Flavobacteriales bacterium]